MLGELCFQMPIKLLCLITVFQELYFFNLQILKTMNHWQHVLSCCRSFLLLLVTTTMCGKSMYFDIKKSCSLISICVIPVHFYCVSHMQIFLFLCMSVSCTYREKQKVDSSDNKIFFKTRQKIREIWLTLLIVTAPSLYDGKIRNIVKR